MPKAEVGSTKYIANKLKAKGLQRLRWYCQICEKQCRDENGFKQHTLSEGHVRAMLLVGEDPKKHIEEYSRQFKRDFLQLLKTSHGEKKVSMNQFYQEYIRDKEHIHMNATKWPSLTEFAKFLGREGICRVEEGDRGLEIQWIDDSPEAIRRREDVKRKERLAKGDEEMEARMLERQIKRAKEEAERRERLEDPKLERTDGEETRDMEPVKVSLNLGSAKSAQPKKQQQQQSPPKEQAEAAPVEITTFSTADTTTPAPAPAQQNDDEEANETSPQPSQHQPPPPPKPSFSLSAAASKPKPANPLMSKKSNPLSSSKKKDVAPSEPEKKMSNAERIMRDEMEAKRKAEERVGGWWKKQRMG